jgi:hypothetical protein
LINQTSAALISQAPTKGRRQSTIAELLKFIERAVLKPDPQ